jgi:hypothetical protein
MHDTQTTCYLCGKTARVGALIGADGVYIGFTEIASHPCAMNDDKNYSYLVEHGTDLDALRDLSPEAKRYLVRQRPKAFNDAAIAIARQRTSDKS